MSVIVDHKTKTSMNRTLCRFEPQTSAHYRLAVGSRLSAGFDFLPSTTSFIKLIPSKPLSCLDWISPFNTHWSKIRERRIVSARCYLKPTLWSTLPTEIVNEILIQAYYLQRESSPLDIWGLRYISWSLRKQIDDYFIRHWIPKLRVRVQFSETNEACYVLDTASKLESPIDQCKVLPLVLKYRSRNYKSRWTINVARQLAAFRGKRSPVKRAKAGHYDIKSALVPDLKVSYTGSNATCDWRRMFTAIYEHEMQRYCGFRWDEQLFEVDVQLFEGKSGRCLCDLVEGPDPGIFHVRDTSCFPGVERENTATDRRAIVRTQPR